MSHQTLKFQLTGISDLMMHSDRAADPLNEFAKAMKKVTGKKIKTEADHLELARIEFLAGLYLKNGKPCLPGHVIEGSIVAAAKKTKQGKQVRSALVVPDDFEIDFEGKNGQTPDDLWEQGKFHDRRSENVRGSKVMRTRPRFKDWSCEVELIFDDTLINEEDVTRILTHAGKIAGVGERRPRFGRFEVEKVK